MLRHHQAMDLELKYSSFAIYSFMSHRKSFFLVDVGSHQLYGMRANNVNLSPCSKPICKNITQNFKILFVFNVEKKVGWWHSAWWKAFDIPLQNGSVHSCHLTKIRGRIMFSHDYTQNSVDQEFIYFLEIFGVFDVVEQCYWPLHNTN